MGVQIEARYQRVRSSASGFMERLACVAYFGIAVPDLRGCVTDKVIAKVTDAVSG